MATTINDVTVFAQQGSMVGCCLETPGLIPVIVIDGNPVVNSAFLGEVSQYYYDTMNTKKNPYAVALRERFPFPARPFVLNVPGVEDDNLPAKAIVVVDNPKFGIREQVTDSLILARENGFELVLLPIFPARRDSGRPEAGGYASLRNTMTALQKGIVSFVASEPGSVNTIIVQAIPTSTKDLSRHLRGFNESLSIAYRDVIGEGE